MELPCLSIFNSALETKKSRIVSADILVCKWVTEICFPDKRFQWKRYEIFCWGAWHFCSNLMGLDWSVLVGWSQMSLRSFWAQVQNQLFYRERFECLAHNKLKNITTALVGIRIRLQEFNVAHWWCTSHCYLLCALFFANLVTTEGRQQLVQYQLWTVWAGTQPIRCATP